MGNCTCINETDRGPDIDLQVRHPIIPSRNMTPTPGESTALGLNDSFPSPPAPTISRPIHVVLLQSAFRRYVISKKVALQQQDWIDISHDPDSLAEETSDYTADPRTLLSPEAAVVLARLQPFQFTRKVRDVVTLSARRLKDGGVFVGQWRGGTGGQFRTGQGRLYQANGGLVEGYWRDGLVHLAGRVLFPNGNLYEGEFVRGVKSGSGSLTLFETGTTYVGDWANDQQHGKGTELLSDGTRYEGQFSNGVKSGQGRLKWPDGTVYTGDFAYNQPNGQGEYRWADGRRYVGQTISGKMHGQGELVYSDGKRYKGGFVGDKKEGLGVYQWDGKTYDGEWVEGKMHGEGWLSGKDIGRKKYEFSQGNRVREIKGT